MKSVSKELKLVIVSLMNEPLLKDFYLGGGTNLSIKYNHRVSTDIDLFSSNIVGLKLITEINELLKVKFKKYDVISNVNNKNTEHLSFIKSNFLINDIPIKIDIIQNIKLYNPIQKIDNIRLINDLDIGALKLLSAADRGTRKDFYDLYLLSNKYGLKLLYKELQKRNKFHNNTIEYENIFTFSTFKPKERLDKNITSLGNMNNASDLSNEGNHIILIKENLLWINLKNDWIKLLKKLSLSENLIFKETPNKKRRKKGLGF